MTSEDSGAPTGRTSSLFFFPLDFLFFSFLWRGAKKKARQKKKELKTLAALANPRVIPLRPASIDITADGIGKFIHNLK